MTQWAWVEMTWALPVVMTDESLQFSTSVFLPRNGYGSIYPVGKVLCESAFTGWKWPPVFVELPAAPGLARTEKDSLNTCLWSSGQSPRRKSSFLGKQEVSQGVTVSCLIFRVVVAASLPDPGLLQDPVGKSTEPTKEVVTTHLLTPASCFSRSWEPTSSAVTFLHPLLSPTHLLMVLFLALTHLLVWRSSLSHQNPLSSPPTGRATANRKEGWQQTPLELGKHVYLCQISIVYTLCATEKPSGSLRPRSFRGGGTYTPPIAKEM